jgi:NTP pyrophosphatase (non-canonical NTP hydrolase)
MNFNFWLCKEDVSDIHPGDNVFSPGKIYRGEEAGGKVMLYNENTKFSYFVIYPDTLESCFEKLNKEDSVCYVAVLEKGFKSQLEMLMEESMEVAHAARKFVRSNFKDCKKELLESEIADIEIMIKQYRMMFPDNKIEEHKRKKIKRLKKRLKNGR